MENVNFNKYIKLNCLYCFGRGMILDSVVVENRILCIPFKTKSSKNIKCPKCSGRGYYNRCLHISKIIEI